MTDTELSSLLSGLRESTNKLNLETSGVNNVISLVELQIQGMNLGLEHWLTRSDWLDSVPDGKEAAERAELGYAKVAGEWCLAVRQARYEDAVSAYSGNYECSVTRIDEPVKLHDSSRDLRIAALEKLPRLISQLKERADEQTRIILDAKKIVGC